MSDWINVKDELPHKNGRYIVYAPTYKGGTAHELGKKAYYLQNGTNIGV